MSSGCLDDLQVLKASENKRDHRLLHELETLLNGGRVSWGFLVWAGVAAFVGWVVFGEGAGYKMTSNVRYGPGYFTPRRLAMGCDMDPRGAAMLQSTGEKRNRRKNYADIHADTPRAAGRFD